MQALRTTGRWSRDLTHVYFVGPPSCTKLKVVPRFLATHLRVSLASSQAKGSCCFLLKAATQKRYKANNRGAHLFFRFSPSPTSQVSTRKLHRHRSAGNLAGNLANELLFVKFVTKANSKNLHVPLVGPMIGYKPAFQNLRRTTPHPTSGTANQKLC